MTVTYDVDQGERSGHILRSGETMVRLIDLSVRTAIRQAMMRRLEIKDKCYVRKGETTSAHLVIPLVATV